MMLLIRVPRLQFNITSCAIKICFLFVCCFFFEQIYHLAWCLPSSLYSLYFQMFIRYWTTEARSWIAEAEMTTCWFYLDKIIGADQHHIFMMFDVAHGFIYTSATYLHRFVLYNLIDLFKIIDKLIVFAIIAKTERFS